MASGSRSPMRRGTPSRRIISRIRPLPTQMRSSLGLDPRLTGEVRLDEGEIDGLRAYRAGVIDFGTQKLDAEGTNLPTPVLWRQSQLNEPVVGQMSANGAARHVDFASLRKFATFRSGLGSRSRCASNSRAWPHAFSSPVGGN